MKMDKSDYEKIERKFSENEGKIKKYYNEVKESGKYNVLEVRVAFDCLRGLLGTKFIIEQYDKGLNDNHIKTACVKALNKVIQ